MKAQLLIAILSLNPEGEIYIDDWDRRKEVTVQIDQHGRVELKAGDVVEDSNNTLGGE